MEKTFAAQLIEAMAQLDEDAILEAVRAAASSGATPEQIQDYMNEGMRQVGLYFEKGEYFIADLMVSGVFYKMALQMLPSKKPATNQRQGKLLIGVVEKDLHDIGKDMVVAALESKGYRVVDLGIDVPSQDFISAIQREKPDILLLSGAISPSRAFMQKTLEAVESAGLRDGLYIVLGGGCIPDQTKSLFGADAVAHSLNETVKYCDAFFLERGEMDA